MMKKNLSLFTPLYYQTNINHLNKKPENFVHKEIRAPVDHNKWIFCLGIRTTCVNPASKIYNKQATLTLD